MPWDFRCAVVASLRSALTLLLAVLVFSCKPRDGGSCKNPLCLDAGVALLCEDGKYIQSACRGPGGCRETAEEVDCDQTLAEPGDRCVNGTVCSVDHKTRLLCDDGSFARSATCSGPRGCYFEGDAVQCDGSSVTVGDPCRIEGDSCTRDRADLAHCDGAHWKLRNRCRGPKGCYQNGASQLHCDQSRSEAGDPCEPGAACGLGGKLFLTCEAGAYAVSRICRGPRGCYQEGEVVRCDLSLSDLGDSCEDDTFSCSTDGEQLLGCQGGKRIVNRPCPRGCRVSGERILCR